MAWMQAWGLRAGGVLASGVLASGGLALGWLPATLAAAGIAYQLASAMALRRYFAEAGHFAGARRTGPQAHGRPAAEPVTLLKPLHGAEPRLGENLASFLVQDYPAPVQLLCGANTREDAAISAVAMLREAHPEADIALTIASETPPSRRDGGAPEARSPAGNGKVGNLMAMMPAAAHELLILSDSDIAVRPDYLAQVTSALAEPGVGAVSCLYVGRGDAGFWSRLGAAMIDWQAMPNMVAGLVTGLARPCMGSTIALRREVLERIGGFERFADVLADDHAIGAAVSELGLAVAVPPLLVTHAGAEASLADLWCHQLRWAVTIRGIAGAGHYGSLVTHALALALVAALFHPGPGLALAGMALLARCALAREVARVAGRSGPSLWLLPAVDGLAFMVFLASLLARRIDWRGQALTMTPDGRITALENGRVAAREIGPIDAPE